MDESPRICSFRALGSACELQIYAAAEMVEHLPLRLSEEVNEFESRYSRYRTESLISKINSLAGSDTFVRVDDQTADIFDFCAHCFVHSEGLFDPTSGVLRRAWNFNAPHIPTISELEQILPLIGWDKVVWRRPDISLPIAGMELDLGGIGKEYLVDVLAGRLQQWGVNSALVNLGGDIRVLGPHPSGDPWNIGLRHPRDPSRSLATLQLTRGAIATSGDYERYFELDGRRYSHILDPRTGWPVESFQSVTVRSDLCLTAGIHCTLAMLMGQKRGESFLADSGLHAVCVRQDGSIAEIAPYSEISNSKRADRPSCP